MPNEVKYRKIAAILESEIRSPAGVPRAILLDAPLVERESTVGLSADHIKEKR